MGFNVGVDVNEDRVPTKAERIAAARADLARRYAENPEAVQRFEARKAHIEVARKRERQRVETLVLGGKPDPEPMPKKPAGMSRSEWKTKKAGILRARRQADAAADRYLGKAGTPETLAAADSTHSGGLEQLERNGTITKDQREWAAQIANVYRSIEADVGVKVASLEARVDQSRRSPAIAERIHRVRMHRAYAIWRDLIPAPKALVLDMIVGDAIGYSVAARRYRVHKRKAKRLLVESIDRWPLCVARAFSAVDQAVVDAMNAATAPYMPVGLNDDPLPPRASYQLARAIEAGREQTDEPYLLPPVDAAFLDDNGYLRPWAEIAAIVRQRVAEMAEAA